MQHENNAHTLSVERRLLVERQRVIQNLSRTIALLIALSTALLTAGVVYFGHMGNVSMANILKEMFAISMTSLSSVIVAAVATRNI